MMSESEGGKVTVLIVEDELLIRWPIAEYLQDCGFTVISASHGEEAVAAIKDYPSKKDVVFSDIRMPGELDGFGLARWIEGNRPQDCGRSHFGPCGCRRRRAGALREAWGDYAKAL
jgi:CheY-like chemotaxis protein